MLGAVLLAGCQGLVSDALFGVERLGTLPDAGVTSQVDAGATTASDGSVAATDSGLWVDAGGPVMTFDAGPALISVFVANGHQGRTLISCDDGKTWVGNRSDNDAFVCWGDSPDGGPGNPDGGSNDCDHTENSGHGVEFLAGWFIASYGHGAPGSIRRSHDGVTWERTVDGTQYSNLVVGDQGRLLAASRSPSWSTDDGQTWQQGPEAAFASAAGDPIWNVRAAAFSNGVFAMFAADTAHEVRVTTDGGTSWVHASMPEICGAKYTVGFGSGGGKLLYVDQSTACVSSDGLTFTAAALPAGASSGPLWTGTEFMVWGQLDAPTYQRIVMRSADGVTWAATPTATRWALSDGGVQLGGGPEVGAVGHNESGAFATVNGGWQGWYQKQQFYRSTDGITWDALPSSAFVGSHPIGRITSGRVPTPALCR